MSKKSMDILVMTSAFVFGMIFSMHHNPLIGVAVLLIVLTTWGLMPKVPQLLKVRINKH